MTRAALKVRRERGGRVIEDALSATLEELARVGYAALRVEEVAERAGLNKTTVYRRWATKEALVRAALLSSFDEAISTAIPDTGSVREDLLEMIRMSVAMAASPTGRTLVRMLSAESPAPEIRAIARSMKAARSAVPLAVLKRAQARQELRADLDLNLFLEVLDAACDRLVAHGATITVPLLGNIVDLVLFGAFPHPAQAARRGRAGGRGGR